MDSEARKAAAREYSRKKRLSPAFRAKESEQQKSYRRRNRAKITDSIRAWKTRRRADPAYRAAESAQSRLGYVRLRERLFAGYGSACACCGENEIAFLELDHVNGGGKQHYTRVGAINLYREVIAAGFPRDYRALCANCNRGRQRNGGHCPHGTALLRLVQT